LKEMSLGLVYRCSDLLDVTYRLLATYINGPLALSTFGQYPPLYGVGYEMLIKASYCIRLAELVDQLLTPFTLASTLNVYQKCLLTNVYQKMLINISRGEI
jgi:hypothetical protein